MECDIPYSLRRYQFPQLGLDLTYSLSHDCFCGLTFSFYTRSIIDGTRKPFAEEVYAHINGSDSANEIRLKIGVEPNETSTSGVIKKTVSSTADKDYWEKYILALAGRPPCDLIVDFTSQTGRLSLLTMIIMDWCGP